MPPAKQQRSLFAADDDAPDGGAAPVEQEAAPVKAPQPAPTASAKKAHGADPSPTDLRGKTVYVVDAPSLIYQVFHAIPEMTSPRGQPVNAVFGFTRDILMMLEGGDADYLFCAFDASGPTFRHSAYEAYKAERSEMPDDLRPQMKIIEDMLAALAVPALELSGYEADDILATIAQQAHDGGARCVLVTGDKDCRQLINDTTFVLNVRKNQLYDRQALQADWGIAPEQVVDFQSLVGDKVDNVPGVPLIGPKIAAELLTEFGDLESVLNNVDRIKGAKRKENLVMYRDQALLSRDLVRLDRNVPIEINWAAARISEFDYPAALSLFIDLGFHGFTEKIRKLAPALGPPPETDTRVVTTAAELQELQTTLLAQPEFACAALKSHPEDRFAAALGIAFSWEANRAVYIPFSERDSALPSFLRRVLTGEGATIVCHDWKSTALALREFGIGAASKNSAHKSVPRGTAARKFDTQLASYLLDAGERDHTLDEASKKRLGQAIPAWKDLLGKRKSGAQLSLAEQSAYAGSRAAATLALKPKLERQLAESELEPLYDDLELPLIDALLEMETNGIAVDLPLLDELRGDFAAHLQNLEQQIHDLAGHEFNIASPKQLQEILFGELGLPVLKKTAKSGPSTDSEVLEDLAEQHPIAALILEHRQYAKLKGTYVDALPALVRPETGRVHADFNQMVAATGRLSCNDPNLQNVPIRSEAGRQIRSAFIPGESGWELLAADYSQIELRVLAHLSGDETLRAAFARDEDIHTTVAAQVFGTSHDDVSSEMRRRAKAVNFGVIYGQTPFGLGKQLKIEPGEAAVFIDAYFARYQGVEAFMAKILADCAANGYVKTILGRRRSIRGIRSSLDRERARRQRNLSERTAINTVIQGSAADLIKLAMLKIHRCLSQESLPARLLLQIHDELVFEAATPQLPSLAALVSREMMNVLPFEVPLKVDLSRGPNLAELRAI